MRTLLTFACILLAATGGVIAYRAAFIAPRAAIVITETGVSEQPNLWHIVLGLALLVTGACIAFYAARRHRRS